MAQRIRSNKALTTLGAPVDLSGLGMDSATALFSESNSRFVVSVAPEKADEFEVLFAGLPIVKIGTVVEEKDLLIAGTIEVVGNEKPRDLHRGVFFG